MLAVIARRMEQQFISKTYCRLSAFNIYVKLQETSDQTPIHLKRLNQANIIKKIGDFFGFLI